MGDRSKLISIAKAEVGYIEGSNNATKYGAWMGRNNQAWCATFISWCADRAQIPGNIIPRTAWVPDYLSFFAKRFKKKGSASPNIGDIVLYDFNNNGSPDHAGIIINVTAGSITTIEGNTSSGSGSQNEGDGVYQRVRPLSLTAIMGFCQPEYKETARMDIRDLAIKNLDTGETISVKAGLQDNENYVRLRDLEKLAPFIIDWDANAKMPTLKSK